MPRIVISSILEKAFGTHAYAIRRYYFQSNIFPLYFENGSKLENWNRQYIG